MGFKNIIFVPMSDHGLIQPIKAKVPETLLRMFGAYQLDISEVTEIATGMDNFKFFITDDFHISHINDN